MDKSPALIRIVIADDHPIFRRGLRSLLETEADLRVTGEAGDGAEAIAQVEKLKPDVLLLDLSMPRMPGMETIRALASGSHAVRTILLTVAIEKRQMVEALQLGARGIVLKDTATELVLKSIRAVMAGDYWVGRERTRDLVKCLAALLEKPSVSAERRDFGLTRRELEVLEAIVGGCTNRDIAQQFSLSEQTVKHHLTNIFDKVGVSNRLELALFAVHHGLVDLKKPPESQL